MKVIKGYLTEVKSGDDIVFISMSHDRHKAHRIGVELSGGEGETYSVTSGVFLPGLLEHADDEVKEYKYIVD